ncbi:MAG: hypothetical protein WBL23_00715, partial [Salinisphaera sp.]|uniref:hypothetical protein n=1 Tax=Salinisphaera sp. TaxID=1914330 RepID=UPI003C79D392
RFTEGTQERYQSAYTASIQVERFEQRWRYRGHVSRQLSVYNRAGERFEKANVNRRAELLPADPDQTAPGWHQWKEWDFGPEPCSPEGDFQPIVDWLVMASAITVVVEKRRLESQFRQMYNGVEALSEID